MINQVSEGQTVQFVATANYTAGAIVVMGSTCGVCVNDVASGATGVAVVKGCFEVPIATAAIGTAIPLGTILKYDSGALAITAGSTLLTSTYIGRAAKAAGTAATTVEVILGL